jgi:hypothetical protein
MPNTRLKLAAPAPNESSGRRKRRCTKIPFVDILAWRRSLSAVR